jgi:hypothetical protein
VRNECSGSVLCFTFANPNLSMPVAMSSKALALMEPFRTATKADFRMRDITAITSVKPDESGSESIEGKLPTQQSIAVRGVHCRPTYSRSAYPKPACRVAREL